VSVSCSCGYILFFYKTGFSGNVVCLRFWLLFCFFGGVLCCWVGVEG